MNLNRPLFGRLTINNKRTDLGHATIQNLFIRAAQTYSIARLNGSDLLITLEISGTRLPESTTLNREAQLEQSLAAQTVVDPNEESPFEGLTIGRVAEAMASPEYQWWAQYCEPTNRSGVDPEDVALARVNYHDAYPDCFPHFPRYVES